MLATDLHDHEICSNLKLSYVVHVSSLSIKLSVLQLVFETTTTIVNLPFAFPPQFLRPYGHWPTEALLATKADELSLFPSQVFLALENVKTKGQRESK